MRKIILLIICLVIFTVPQFAQKTDNISEVPPINKGKIILRDGTIIQFRNLSVSADSVSIINSHSIMCKYHQNSIYRISKTGNYLLEGTLCGGLS